MWFTLDTVVNTSNKFGYFVDIIDISKISTYPRNIFVRGKILPISNSGIRIQRVIKTTMEPPPETS